MPGLFEMIVGLLGFLAFLFSFIALMSIWGNTGRAADYARDLLYLKRFQAGLDPKTGKPLEAKT